VFGASEVMKLVELARSQPGPGQVLVRMRGIGVNPVGPAYPRKPALPYTFANDGTGVIEQLGEGESKFRLGRSVSPPGQSAGRTPSWHSASRCRCILCQPRLRSAGAQRWDTVRHGASRVSFSERRRIRAKRCWSHGATGGVGTAAAQLARARGLRVLGAAGTERSARPGARARRA
jgi:NADPH2:quinone reductase